ncbi:MAG: efflux RND transporter permease subunit, partial [Rhizobacter sp.]
GAGPLGSGPAPAPPASRVQRFFGDVMNRYDRSLVWVIDHQAITLIIALATFALTALLYVMIPKGLFPTQDTGQLQGRIQAAQDVSYERMAQLQQQAATAILEEPDVESLSSFVGVDAANNTMLHAGSLLINLKKSHGDQQALMNRLRERVRQVAGVTLYLQPTQDLTIDAETGPTQYRVSLEGVDSATITLWMNKLIERLQDAKQVRNVSSDAGAQGLAASIEVNRDTASRLGITASSVDDALYSAFGQRIVSTIFTQTNQYRVILEARPDGAASPATLGAVQLRTSSG